MSKSVGMAAGILLSLLRTSSAAESLAGPEEGGGAVIVRAYDYASLPKPTLAGAEKEASRILRRAGLETEWLECSVSGGGGPRRCLQPLGLTEVTLRILPDRAKALLPLAADVFGFAVVPEDGSRGVDIGVFRDGIDRLASLGAISQSQILGHVIAHEIGHLLLGSQAHSASGIMRPRWSSNDLVRAARGGLVFTPEEGRHLRAATAGRRASTEAGLPGPGS